MTIRKSLDGNAIGLMLLLCLCWGLQQVAVKMAAHAISSTLQLGLRSGIAAVLVLALISLRKIPFTLTAASAPGFAGGSAVRRRISGGLVRTQFHHGIAHVGVLIHRAHLHGACTALADSGRTPAGAAMAGDIDGLWWRRHCVFRRVWQ
jgi:hypothetical protein